MIMIYSLIDAKTGQPDIQMITKYEGQLFSRSTSLAQMCCETYDRQDDDMLVERTPRRVKMSSGIWRARTFFQAYLDDLAAAKLRLALVLHCMDYHPVFLVI